MITVFHYGLLSGDLKKILDFNKQKNKITFIGNDDSISKLENVEFIDFRDFGGSYFGFFVENFEVKHAITPEYQQQTFLRAFVLCSLFLDHGYDSFYHMDSDTILLKEERELPKFTQDAYFRPQDYGNKYRLGDSIHFSYLTKEFANAFLDVFNDFYIYKNQGWAEEKMKWHEENNVIGELIDMNFYSLVSRDIEPLNLLDPALCKEGVFDFNIASPEGKESKNFWKIEDGIKKLIKEKDEYYFVDNEDNKYCALSLHLQGLNKTLINKLV